MGEKENSSLNYPQDLTVLYVEDNKEVRESTTEMLKLFFKTVDISKNGLCGEEKYTNYYNTHQCYYDIVITDINMPKLNGIELSKRILLSNPKQHIMVISAHNEANYLLELIQIGVSNFILKPIEFKLFKPKIDMLTQSILNQRSVDKEQETLRNMNSLLLEAQQKAQDASEHKSRFLANMSHEIRTPLNAIRGFISLLNEEEDEKEKLQYIDIINNASDCLLQIINDILDISKIEEGQMTKDEIDFNPHDMLKKTINIFKSKASEVDVTLSINYSNILPKTLYGDIFKSQQVFTNLISNALKFTPKGANIYCDISYEDTKLVLSVKDEGIGISKKNQEHIFNSFSQAEDSTTREYGGTGLGLSISRKIATLLGGTIAVESELNKGSTFILSLPMKKGKALSTQEIKQGKKSSKINKGFVLIVEDIETNRLFLSILLKKAGVKYEMAVNGLEAIEKFKNNKYDIILMDENMPKCSGSEATQKIRQIEKTELRQATTIISLTANAFQGDKEKFLAQGMDDYISKPISPKTLLELLEKYLG